MPQRRHFIQSCTTLAGAGWLAGVTRQGVAQTPVRPSAQLLRVGQDRSIKTIGEAARAAVAGSVIEVDAGDYLGDVAVWERDGISVRAVGGRVRLIANGVSAEDKGTWVVRAKGMQVRGFDFEGAAASGRNGAGIRLESGTLLVRDCRFLRNEMGLLTGNEPTIELDVHNSEFAFNQRPDGHNHNLYAGQIGRLSVTASYFHHARTGHLLKSRAAQNHIVCNRLTDEPGGTASYELEFPNGGIAHVIGNLIEQNAQTENPHLISFGAEGYHWARNEIHLAHNTLVDRLPQGGIFLRVTPGAAVTRAINNLLVGASHLEAAGPGDYRNNLRADPGDFAAPERYDFRLRDGSRLVGAAVDPGPANGHALRQELEYTHPRATRSLKAAAHNPGAFQSIAPATLR